MDDKKVTQSITLVGGFLAMLLQSLIGFEVIPTDAHGMANEAIENLMELARNIAALVALYGVRRKLGETTE